MQQPLVPIAEEIAGILSRLRLKIVFAESCTGGLISATMARVPGASNFHCGSAVVYRLATKTQWLGIPASVLIDPGPVSEPVARLMGEGALDHTPEADLAASITGHLGPNAPAGQDGLIFVGIAIRGKICRVVEHRLPQFPDASGYPYPGESEREQRQWAAVAFVLAEVIETLRGFDSAKLESRI